MSNKFGVKAFLSLFEGTVKSKNPLSNSKGPCVCVCVSVCVCVLCVHVCLFVVCGVQARARVCSCLSVHGLSCLEWWRKHKSMGSLTMVSWLHMFCFCYVLSLQFLNLYFTSKDKIPFKLQTRKKINDDVWHRAVMNKLIWQLRNKLAQTKSTCGEKMEKIWRP